MIHSLDGYDEISLTGAFRISSSLGDGQFHPCDLGLSRHRPSDLLVGGGVEAAKIITLDILNNRGSLAMQEVVLANSAAAIYLSGRARSLREGLKVAKRSLENGDAIRSLDQAIRISQEA